MLKQPSYIAVFFLTWMVVPGAVWADKRPVPVAPGGPSGGTAVSRACPTFHWSVSSAMGVAGYELAVYRVGGEEAGGLTPAAEPVLHHRLPAGASGWTLPPDRCLAPSGRYAWSVRAVGEGVEGDWSEPALFEVAAVPSLAEVEEALEVLRRFERSNERSRAEPGEAEAAMAVTTPTASASGVHGASGALETAQVGTNAAPAASSSPSLSVDGQIHLGSAGDVFRDGVPFLWTDGTATSGSGSVALGMRALESNTANNNTAVGHTALTANTTGSRNSAFGEDALSFNTTGAANSAFGEDVLLLNTTGFSNSAFGEDALFSNTTGSRNNAFGQAALRSNTTGSDNIAIGRNAGTGITTGSNNIMIGNTGSGVSQSIPEIRIGDQGTQGHTRIAGIFGVSLSGSNVVVQSTGRLGVSASSRRFKEDVRDMGEVADKLSKLRPVRFRFKTEDSESGERPLEYGLIAEEVAEVLPELVPLDAEGRPYAVRYDLLSTLLLSELQRQQQEYHRIDQENRRTDLAQARLLAAQRRDIEALRQELAAVRPAAKGRGARKR